MHLGEEEEPLEDLVIRALVTSGIDKRREDDAEDDAHACESALRSAPE